MSSVSSTQIYTTPSVDTEETTEISYWFPIIFMTLIALVCCVAVVVPLVLYIQRYLRNRKRKPPDGRTLFQYCERERSKHAMLLGESQNDELGYSISTIEPQTQIFSPYLSDDQRTELAFEIMSSASSGTWQSSGGVSQQSVMSLPLRQQPSSSRRSSIASIRSGSSRSSRNSRNSIAMSVASAPLPHQHNGGGRPWSRQKRPRQPLFGAQSQEPQIRRDPTLPFANPNESRKSKRRRKLMQGAEWAIKEDHHFTPRTTKKPDVARQGGAQDIVRDSRGKLRSKKVLRPSPYQQQKHPSRFRPMPNNRKKKGKSKGRNFSDNDLLARPIRKQHSYTFKNLRDSLQISHQQWGSKKPTSSRWQADHREFFDDMAFRPGTGGMQFPDIDLGDRGGGECPSPTISEGSPHKHYWCEKRNSGWQISRSSGDILFLEGGFELGKPLQNNHDRMAGHRGLLIDISRSRSRSEGISDNVTAYSDSDFSEQNLQHSDFDNLDESGGEVTPRAV